MDSTVIGNNFMAEMQWRKQERTKNNSTRSEAGGFKKKRRNIIIKNLASKNFCV